MTPLLTLGLRLARAGGPLRMWSIAVGNALGVLLVLVALALPAGLFPDPGQRAENTITHLTVVTFFLVPAVVLLVTVGRLSSGTRDRRLASLRMIGLTPRRTRRVAAVENGGLALVGAVAGAVAFVAAVGPLSGVLARGSSWLQGSLRLDLWVLVVVVAGVTALSVLVGTGATWERQLVTAARSEATQRLPHPWRLIILAIGIGALAWGSRLDTATAHHLVVTWSFLGGALLTGVGLALVTPLVVSWVARLLVRSSAVTPLLAGRSIQSDGAAAGRVVAGLAVAIFLTTGALGVLGAFESTPQYANAIRAFGPGPQRVFIDLWNPDGDQVHPAFDAALRTSLEQVPGVRSVNPTAASVGSGGDRVFVGTCAQLEAVAEVRGCDDSRAASIVDDGEPRPGWYSASGRPDLTGTSLDLTWSEFDAYLPDGTPDRQTVELTGPPILVDLEAQHRTWTWGPNFVAFVPAALLDAPQPDPLNTQVIADGGAAVAAAISEWAAENNVSAWQPDAGDFRTITAVRTAIWSLCAVVVAVALVVLALGAADRAAERRRAVARQITVGMPAGVLRRSQLLQVLLPVLVACGLSIGAGMVGVNAYTNLADATSLLGGQAWAGLALVSGVGGLIVALTTLPLIRARLTPELLRRE